MKTVREIFSKAFGEVPEGATCHVKCEDDDAFTPTFWFATKGIERCLKETFQWFGKWELIDEYPLGPDISDRPASAFRGFFGAEYDNCLDAEGEKK